jgi:phage terminase large subunit-like protein
VGERLTRGDKNIRWIETHCRIPEGKFVGDKVELRPWQKKEIKRIYDNPHGTRTAILSFGRKNAKALDVDTPIPTPIGWRTIGDIDAGDFVYGSDGSAVQVFAVSEVFTDKPCYDVTFSDGSVIRCSGDHLWTTTHRYRPWAKARVNGSGFGGRPRTDTVTTEQIANSLHVPRADGGRESNHKLRVGGATDCCDVDLPIDPYVLGYWLGDGTSSCAAFTCAEDDLSHVVHSVSAEGNVVVAHYDNRAPRVRVNGGLQKRLRLLGLLGNKHVPGLYFDGSSDQRRALLQGLMDSDGTVNRHAGRTTARCSFTNKSRELAYSVWRLARSLGIKATIREFDVKIGDKGCGVAYETSFTASKSDAVFRLERKLDLLPDEVAKRSSTLTIVDCKRVETVNTKCLMVDAPDSLFLVGHGCILTHNTTLSAFLLLLHLAGRESVPNSQLVSTAKSRDQAALLFDLAAKIVRMSPTLCDFIGIRAASKNLYCPDRGTVYRALSADASTNLGSSPVFAVHDELGAVKGPRSELYEAVETGAGAHEHPLSIIISTQAPTDNDLLSILIDDALAGHDPRVVVSLYACPLDDDPFVVSSIKKANPAYGDFLNADEVKKSANAAKRMPAREASYRNLILNQRVEATTPFITRTVWQGCEGALRKLRGPLYGGLDLSARKDLTALVLVHKEGSQWHIHPYFWVPQEGIRERSAQDRVPYDVWAKEGYLRTTPGHTVDYEYIAHDIGEILGGERVQAVAYDRWRIDLMQKELDRIGLRLPLVPHGQGYKDMSPALDVTESEILNSRVVHDGNPVLSMCAANAVVQTDPSGNRKLAKDKSSGRIDGMVALVMAMAVTNETPEYYASGRLVTL